MRRAFLLSSLAVLFLATARAQDPVKVDANHYKVEFQNDRVRVLRISYGPHEKSVMHYHPAGVAVFLTDAHVRFAFPDGKTQEAEKKAGEFMWNPAGKHLPENLSDQRLELVLVELKGGAAAAKKPAKP